MEGPQARALLSAHPQSHSLIPRQATDRGDPLAPGRQLVPAGGLLGSGRHAAGQRGCAARLRPRTRRPADGEVGSRGVQGEGERREMVGGPCLCRCAAVATPSGRRGCPKRKTSERSEREGRRASGALARSRRGLRSLALSRSLMLSRHAPSPRGSAAAAGPPRGGWAGPILLSAGRPGARMRRCQVRGCVFLARTPPLSLAPSTACGGALQPFPALPFLCLMRRRAPPRTRPRAPSDSHTPSLLSSPLLFLSSPLSPNSPLPRPRLPPRPLPRIPPAPHPRPRPPTRPRPPPSPRAWPPPCTPSKPLPASPPASQTRWPPWRRRGSKPTRAGGRRGTWPGSWCGRGRATRARRATRPPPPRTWPWSG